MCIRDRSLVPCPAHLSNDPLTATVVAVILCAMNSLSRLVLPAVLASTLVWPIAAGAQSESAGVAQYFNNCASCHESTDPTHQAPRTAVLKQMTPEHVLDVLTNGSMRSNAAALSDADKRLIAEWVGGRKIDSESVGAADKMTNLCSTHPPMRESNGPAWNGWGADLHLSLIHISEPTRLLSISYAVFCL